MGWGIINEGLKAVKKRIMGSKPRKQSIAMLIGKKDGEKEGGRCKAILAAAATCMCPRQGWGRGRARGDLNLKMSKVALE